MISDDASDGNISPISSVSERFENGHSFYNPGVKVESAVLNELQMCYLKIETIMSEHGASIQFLDEMYELKESFVSIIQLIQEHMCKSTSSEIHHFSSKIIPATSKEQNHKTNEENTKTNEQEYIVKTTLETPRVEGLDNIAGLSEVKKILKSLVILPRHQPQLFLNKKAFNSILLFGPPGTGKTQLVHALAYEANARLHCVTVSDILTPLVGQSEKNIQYIFHHLMHCPEFTILFIDELDGLCKKRNDSEQEHSRRIKTELMCQISKIENYSNLFLICATNCPWDLDSAFLRRFLKRIYIPLPNSEERCELFQLFTKNTPLARINDWTNLLKQTEGYSGSDISQIVQYALNIPIFELEDTKLWKICTDGFYEPVGKTDDFNIERIVCSDLSDLPPYKVRARNPVPLDLITALGTVRVTVTKGDIKRYSSFDTSH